MNAVMVAMMNKEIGSYKASRVFIICLPHHSSQKMQPLHKVRIRKTNYMSLFVFFISLLMVAQYVSGNHVPIIRS